MGRLGPLSLFPFRLLTGGVMTDIDFQSMNWGTSSKRGTWLTSIVNPTRFQALLALT